MDHYETEKEKTMKEKFFDLLNNEKLKKSINRKSNI
jgi:hypothetical protein